MTQNRLIHGDNLDVMRREIATESVNLCYIDPPFHSKRDYFQVYNNQANGNRVKAFVDTWEWGSEAEDGITWINDISRLNTEILTPQTVALIKGLDAVLGRGSLFAYLIHMTQRIVEIHRVLKPTGSFYLHCDPTASHYLKLICDGIFCGQGGDFQNEIIWSYQTGGASKTRFARKHDVIFFYTKSHQFVFNSEEIREPRTQKSLKRALNPNGARITMEDIDKLPTDVFQIQALNPMATERLGYPTQKPEALLERIIRASSNEGNTVLDAYCGSGTTIAVSQRLRRRWIGIDSNKQAILLVQKRLAMDTALVFSQP